MPRNVRNFWIELTVDGKRTRIETGPQAKEGGFTLTVMQRHKGDVFKAATVIGDAANGQLALTLQAESHTYTAAEDGSEIVIRSER